MAVSKVLKEYGFANIEIIGFPLLISFGGFWFYFGLVWVFFPETMGRLDLCNLLGDIRAAEGEMLSKCSLTIIIVNKASVLPVLYCTCVIMHLEFTDL